MVKKNEYFWKTHGSVINAMGMKKLKKKKHLRKQSGVSCIRWGPHVATKRVRQLGGGMGGATDLVTLDISNLLDLASDRSLTR